jgi:transcriptional regulator with GAF, ATPase, and Fis domain
VIGTSAAFLAVVRQIERVAGYDVPVLIEGETGTGKELAARAIHYRSRRRDSPFVPVNCGALPESLIENEFFGHCRGAFTDAREEWPGLLRLAHHGTLFLDEIDAMPARGQVALLRFLQDYQFRPLGGRKSCEADVRVIAAANHNLEELAEHRVFRIDLLFRLKLIGLEIPPLRARSGDSILLAEHFVSQCVTRYGIAGKRLHPAAKEWFLQYGWPGNVRELENLVYREALLNDGAQICARPPSSLHRRTAIEAPSPGATTSDDAGHKFNDAGYKVARARALEAFDRAYLAGVMTRTHGNVTQAAKLAGKERRALGKLLKKYGIASVAFERAASRSSAPANELLVARDNTASPRESQNARSPTNGA